MVEKYDTHNDKIRGKTENFYFGAMNEQRKRDTWRKKKEMQGAKRKKSYMT